MYKQKTNVKNTSIITARPPSEKKYTPSENKTTKILFNENLVLIELTIKTMIDAYTKGFAK